MPWLIALFVPWNAACAYFCSHELREFAEQLTRPAACSIGWKTRSGQGNTNLWLQMRNVRKPDYSTTICRNKWLRCNFEISALWKRTAACSRPVWLRAGAETL